MDFIQEESRDLKGLFNRFRRKDFSGTAGQAIKNSSYQLTQNLIFKIGSLIFTIIIARMLLPDLMGLYNLSLATIILFSAFSDLGISSALITYGSKMLGKGKPEKAKAYVKKLFKWKLWLMFIASGILLASAYFIAEIYYTKPIFYALLVGGLYLPIVSLLGFVEQMFKTTENFREPTIKEIIFQVVRLILVPLTIFLFLKAGISDQGMIAITLLALAISYFIALLFLIWKAKRKIGFLQVKSKNLTKPEVNDLKKFLYPLTAMAMAGLFFGYIDTLMLGHFVSSKFIAFYGAAFSLVGGAAAIIGFAAAAMMPIFARKSGKALETIFRKTRNATIIISTLAGIFTYFVAYYVIRLAYGIEYIQAVPILKWFAILVVIIPIIGIYDGYFITQKKTKPLAWLIVVSAVLNIIFNFFAITYGLKIGGEMGAVFGAVGATMLSRVIYFGGLVIFRKKMKKH